ncbi:MAG: RluA family pseudouridine synthase [Oscillospiraceae bacterium]|nr:RluA family pseudouridine synthase [Oscillospiraceae bacterium]
MKEYEFIVEEDFSGERIDRYLSVKLSNITRSRIQIIAENGGISVGGKTVGKNYKVKSGETISFFEDEPEEIDVSPEDIPLDIVYEDSDVIVVNKKKGMVVHPASGNKSGTLVNALLFHCKGSLSGINGYLRPGIVHRIDKDTSGLIIAAKNNISHVSLAEQIKVHAVKRVYYAICYGHLKEKSGTIDAPIGRDKKDRKKMAVTKENSKNAITHYEVLAEYDKFSLIKAKLETGRTHQIRVHFSHIGHPLAGDVVYGPKKVITALEGQCLHAKEIEFQHPTSGEKIHLETDLPEYFRKFISQQKERII